MIIELENYHRGLGCFNFDTENGNATKSKIENTKNIKWGFVFNQNNIWYAMYEGEKSILFQTKKNIWELTNDIRIDVSGSLIRKFKIRSKLYKGMTIYYWKFPWWTVDPTWDEIDETTSDYFRTVKRTWEKYKNGNYSELRNKYYETTKEFIKNEK